MRSMKKVISLLLCVLMVATAIPMVAFAADDAENTESTANVGYLWDFEDKEVGVKLSDADFNNKVENVVWGGENGYPTSNWETAVDPEDENNIVLNPLAKRTGSAGGNDFYYNGINFKNFGTVDGRMIEFSYDIYMTARAKANNDIPLLRVYYKENGSEKKPTMVALNTSDEVAPGTATTETSMGKLQVGSTVTSTELFALTWYNVRMQFDTMTGNVSCYINDTFVATASIAEWSPATCEISYLIGLRCYDVNHCVTAYVDDIYLGYVSEFGKSDFADVTDMSYKGFTLTTADSKMTNWSVVTDGDNTYMKHTGAAQPLTWSDDVGLLDKGVFSYSFDYRSTTSSSGGLYSVYVDRASNKDGQEFRIIHQNGNILTFGPTTQTNVGLNIARITTGAEAKWHNIKTVFKPYVTEDYINMNYEFYVDGNLAAYTDIIEGVDDNGNATYCYNFYTKITGEWTVRADIQPAKHMQYIKSGDTNGNGVADEDETVEYAFKWTIDSKSPWTDTTNNCFRAPAGFWDGYYKGYIDGVGESGVVDQDGKIALFNSIYMFHYNANTFDLDNMKVNLLEEPETIENVDLLGYQLGADGTSVRFIAGVDSLDFGQVGMDIETFDPLSTEGWVAKVDNKMSNAVYTVLTADGEQVAAKEAFGSRFFAMLSVYDIDSSAIIGVHPYTTKDGERTYGDRVVYSVVYDADKGLSVEPVPTYVRDYDDGVVRGKITDGYSKSTYAQLIDPDGDWGSGGEGGGRAVSGVDGMMKILVSRQYSSSKNGYVSYVDEETEEEVFVLDEAGNKIPKYNTMSARYKLANVIPVKYDDLVGKTVVFTAKVKVAEVSRLDTDTVNVTADNGEIYNVPTAVVDPTVEANISVGFGDDAQWSYLGQQTAGNYKYYSLPVSDEWVEVCASIDITEEFVAGQVHSGKFDEQPVPLRPVITVGSLAGWASELYVDDATCTVIPTPVAAE